MITNDVMFEREREREKKDWQLCEKSLNYYKKSFLFASQTKTKIAKDASFLSADKAKIATNTPFLSANKANSNDLNKNLFINKNATISTILSVFNARITNNHLVKRSHKLCLYVGFLTQFMAI